MGSKASKQISLVQNDQFDFVSRFWLDIHVRMSAPRKRSPDTELFGHRHCLLGILSRSISKRALQAHDAPSACRNPKASRMNAHGRGGGAAQPLTQRRIVNGGLRTQTRDRTRGAYIHLMPVRRGVGGIGDGPHWLEGREGQCDDWGGCSMIFKKRQAKKTARSKGLAKCFSSVDRPLFSFIYHPSFASLL